MERYTDLNLKQFVASSADIRWCPFPDCGYAICTNREEKEVDVPVGGASRLVTGGRASSEALLTAGENVECGQGHGFCWYVVLIIGNFDFTGSFSFFAEYCTLII